MPCIDTQVRATRNEEKSLQLVKDDQKGRKERERVERRENLLIVGYANPMV